MVSAATRRLEVRGGLLLLVVLPATIDRVVTSLTQHELSEDPHDVLATHLLRTTHGLTGLAVQRKALFAAGPSQRSHQLTESVGLAVGDQPDVEIIRAV